jgi:hypothetical protein
MGNSPIAAKEETRYFTPRALHRIPVSEYDWKRLKNLASDGPARRNWPSFVRSLSLGVVVSSVFNLIQLVVLSPNGGYPTWVWVVAVALLVGSATALAFSQALTVAHAQSTARPLQAVADELLRIEEMFEPLDEDDGIGQVATSGSIVVDASLPKRAFGGVASATTADLASAGSAPRIPPTGFSQGDRLQHKSFGVGTVRKAKGDALEVEFDDGATKRLLASYAPIRRLPRDDRSE